MVFRDRNYEGVIYTLHGFPPLQSHAATMALVESKQSLDLQALLRNKDQVTTSKHMPHMLL